MGKAQYFVLETLIYFAQLIPFDLHIIPLKFNEILFSSNYARIMFLYSSFQYLLPGQWQSYWKFKKLTSRNGGLPSQNLSKSFDFKSLKFSSRTSTWGWRKTNKQFNESPTLFGSLKKKPNTNQGPSWSYGSWIYNYLCNQCISCENPVQARCTRYNIMW